MSLSRKLKQDGLKLNGIQTEELLKLAQSVGEEELLKLIAQTSQALNEKVTKYQTRNEKVKSNPHPFNYASSGTEDTLGMMIAYTQMLRTLLDAKYANSETDIDNAIQRCVDHAELSLENEPAEDNVIYLNQFRKTPPRPRIVIIQEPFKAPASDSGDDDSNFGMT